MPATRIAVAQAAARSGDVPYNVATACRLVAQAAEKGASILLLPELFLCGYDLDAMARTPERMAIAPDDTVLDPLRAVCRDVGLNVITGACVRNEQGYANSALVIGDDGKLRAIYNKIHLWTSELPHFVPGETPVLLEIAGFRTGLAICYDAGFPEHCRALALAGAELILCPSAFSHGEEERRYDLYFPMRALENTVYLAVANLVGNAAGLDFFGRGAVFDPSGAPLAIAGDAEAVIVAAIDHDRLAAVRDDLRYLEHRRPALYGTLHDEEDARDHATLSKG